MYSQVKPVYRPAAIPPQFQQKWDSLTEGFRLLEAERNQLKAEVDRLSGILEQMGGGEVNLDLVAFLRRTLGQIIDSHESAIDNLHIGRAHDALKRLEALGPKIEKLREVLSFQLAGSRKSH